MHNLRHSLLRDDNAAWRYDLTLTLTEIYSLLEPRGSTANNNSQLTICILPWSSFETHHSCMIGVEFLAFPANKPAWLHHYKAMGRSSPRDARTTHDFRSINCRLHVRHAAAVVISSQFYWFAICPSPNWTLSCNVRLVTVNLRPVATLRIKFDTLHTNQVNINLLCRSVDEFNLWTKENETNAASVSVQVATESKYSLRLVQLKLNVGCMARSLLAFFFVLFSFYKFINRLSVLDTQAI
jgi:hypothetical protein